MSCLVGTHWGNKIWNKALELCGRRNSLRFEEMSARCGRCAHVLPDETLSYCPKCGIPFSKVPPTSTFLTLADRAHELLLKRYRWRLIGSTSLVFVAFWALLGSIITLQSESLLTQLKPVRDLEVYVYEDPQYHALTDATKIASIGVAVQSVQEHFGISINNISIHYNETPPELADRFPNFWTDPRNSTLSFWESQIYPQLSMGWKELSTKSHTVLFTNIPILNDLGKRSATETSHLNSQGMISGLGHPALTVITSYRLLREEASLIERGLSVSEGERQQNLAKFMGEYVLAHELGHALLALPDYVEPTRMPTNMALRGPASVDGDVVFGEEKYANCLMHTDRGGGAQAWLSIQNRKPGSVEVDACPEYAPVIKAFHLRTQALGALQNGDREKAEALYTELLRIYAPQSQTWLHHQWEQESQLFMSFIRRWWEGFFVIESSL